MTVEDNYPVYKAMLCWTVMLSCKKHKMITQIYRAAAEMYIALYHERDNVLIRKTKQEGLSIPWLL